MKMSAFVFPSKIVNKNLNPGSGELTPEIVKSPKEIGHGESYFLVFEF